MAPRRYLWVYFLYNHIGTVYIMNGVLRLVLVTTNNTPQVFFFCFDGGEGGERCF